MKTSKFSNKNSILFKTDADYLKINDSFNKNLKKIKEKKNDKFAMMYNEVF